MIGKMANARMGKYSEADVISKFKKDCVRFPYRSPCVKYSGVCLKTRRPYVDVLAKYILKKEAPLFEQEMLDDPSKGKHYELKSSFENGHSESSLKCALEKLTNQYEKMLVRKWVNEQKRFSKLGTCFEYELNLICGPHLNIDLLTYENGTLYLIEVKGVKDKAKYKTPETLLRAALEITTYEKMLIKNIENFKRDISHSPMARRAFGNQWPLHIEKIKKAILIPEFGPAFEEWSGIQRSTNYSNLEKLLTKNEIEVMVYGQSDY